VHQDLNFQEVNSFLAVYHKLNLQALLNAIHLHTSDFDNYDMRTAGINLYAINGCKAFTITKVNEVQHHFFGKDYLSYWAPIEAPGDGTVPLESSTNLPIDAGNKFYALRGEHGEMLSAEGIRQQIVNILSGSTLSTKDSEDKDIITQDVSKCELNGRAISIYSPLSIGIIDQNGNHAGFLEDGVSIENNIPNADFQIMGEHKFVYLPTDDGQTYTINVTGTGSGTFTLTDANIDANNITSMQVFQNISVTPSLLGHLNISDNTTLAIDDNGDETIDRTLSPTFRLSGAEARDFIPEPENVEVVPEKNNSSGSRSTGSYVKKQVVLQSEEVVEPLVPTPDHLIKNITIKQKIKNPKVTQIENIPKDNLLTANVINTNALVNYKIIVTLLSGVLGLLLLAKKFNKR
jgi:hypothetical protein